MTYIIRTNLAPRVSTIEVIDGDTGSVLTTDTLHNAPDWLVYKQRNKLSEALINEPDVLAVRSQTCDWRGR